MHDGADSPTSVGGGALLLGYAGLMPAGAATLLIAGHVYQAGVMIAFAYPALILSFLGGIWWGFAMRRRERQAPLAALAVLPSLVALALGVWLVGSGEVRAALIALGLAILLTLIVDQRLERGGDAPAGWMRLRAPLSVGLAALTILSGLLVPPLDGPLG